MFTQMCWLSITHCALYKSEIYSKDFAGCANNPQIVAEQNNCERTPHPSDGIILLINLSLSKKMCLRFPVSYASKILSPAVHRILKHLPLLDTFRVYFYGFFSLISCRKCLSRLSEENVKPAPGCLHFNTPSVHS